MKYIVANIIVSVVVLLIIITEAKKPKLLKYNVDPSSITVSGISSGGAMAMQFQIIHSKKIIGAAIFAGGPYLCAKPGLLTASICMLTPSRIDVDRLIEGTLNLAKKGKIDDPINLANEKAWIFHGTKDSVVAPAGGKKIEEFYKHFGTNVTTVFNIESEHGFPTENNGGPCGTLILLQNFINKCNYNGAFESLNNLYGNTLTKDRFGSPTNIVDFDQTEFDNILITLDTSGFIYVPNACKDGTVQCKLHIAFHGCLSSSTYVGKGYLTETGYMDVAEQNNIIILAPQVSTLINPPHCWDWWGYTGLSYANKDGAQIHAVEKMLNRILGN